MSRSLLVPLMVCAGCATTPAAPAADGLDGWCWFNKARWTPPSARLDVRGGAFAIGSSRGRAPALEGVVRPRSPHPVLEVSLQGGGVAVRGEVDLTTEAVLLAKKPVTLGDFGLIVEGGSISVVGGKRGELEVSAGKWAAADLAFAAPATATVRCEETRLEAIHPFDEGKTLDARAQLKPDAEGALATLPLPFRSAPAGEVRFTLQGKEPRFVRVLERRGEWARAVVSHWAGNYWFGWVPASALQPVPPGGRDILGMLGGSAGGEKPIESFTRCDRKLKLWAAHGDQVVEIGAIDAERDLRLGEREGDRVRVTLPDGWLSASKDTRLLTEGSAARCPTSL